MNSYTLGISGYWYLPLILGVIGIAIAFISYRKTIPPISKTKKTALLLLRGLAIATLLFVLLEPVVNMVSGSQVEPKLAVLLDNSVSAVQQDASGSRLESYNNSIKNTDFISLGDDKLNVTLFDADTKFLNEFNSDEFHPDSIKHEGQLTDISAALKWVARNSEEENIQAVLMLSDGVFNSGNNPIYDAELLGKPIYIVGIGDSSEPKDISIQSILTNEIAYVDNPVPVNINIDVNGFEEGELKLILTDNGSKVKEETIKLHPERKNYTSVMEYHPKTEGIHKLGASVTVLDGEITARNNHNSEFIKILKNKRNVCIFAGAPSSDLSFMKNTLMKEKGMEVKTFIQKQGAQFYGEQATKKDLKETELIVFIGFPIQTTSQATLNLIREELSNGKPFLFMASKSTDYKKLAMFEEFLPFNTASTKPNEFLALPDVLPKAVSNPVLRINGTEKDVDFWNKLPPLYKTETFVKAKPESEIISTMKVNNVSMKEPLILSRSFQNRKSLAILGYGLYRWKLIGYAAEQAKGREEVPDLYDIFINNAFRWLAVKQDNKNIRIKTSRKHYTEAEKVEFIAQVYDKAYVPVENATVTVKARGGEELRELTLASLGNGRYNGSIEGLPPGDYAFSGEALLNGNKLGSDNGRFSVGEIDLEFTNLRMNASLLRTMAERSGGKFYTPDESTSFINDLENNPKFKAKAVTLRSEINLWELPYLLGFAILCFSIEWFLRKKFGMV